MTYNDLIVLIPSHSLEDFPTELPDDKAEGLLNAFAVLWHPRLLATARVLPSWHRADDPPHFTRERLILIPPTCEDRVSPEWIDRTRAEEGIVITGISSRQELVSAVLEPLDRVAVTPEANEDGSQPVAETVEPVTVDPELTADFLAFGACHLQTELLTRHMHHFTNMDEAHLKREAIAAADAALADDAAAARTHLRNCFEILLEARERFYPVDCFLIDLCLMIPTTAGESFRKLLVSERPLNVVAAAADLETIAVEQPESVAALKQAWENETVDVIGGEYLERPSPLLPIESMHWDFQAGHQVFRKVLDRLPTTWGRRRFGLTTMMPHVISRRGYHAALHVAFDDGIYPDAEHSKIRWEGCDGSILDAITRIPLAADSAASFLRFPVRMSEAMEQDQVAAVMFARWPDMKGPWLEDFARMSKYAPVLGRFVTLHEFFRETDDPGRLSRFEAKEYLSPFFIQAVAREERDPISRFADHHIRRAKFDAGSWCARMARILSGRPVLSEDERNCERELEKSGPDLPKSEDSVEVTPIEQSTSELATAMSIDACIDRFVESSGNDLTRLVMHGAANSPGYLIWNTLSFQRIVTVELPKLETPPAIGGFVRGVQLDDRHHSVSVEIAGSGFVWIPLTSPPAVPSAPSRGASAQQNVLRNEFIEVHINEVTGGIGEIKEPGRRANRLSEQLAFRFPSERSFLVGQGDDKDEVRSYYSAMRCRSLTVTSNGPGLAEIVSVGELIDQTDGSRLAEFRQTTRLWRGRRDVEVEIELDTSRMPEGDPWSNYIAARFAWNDSDAALTRSLQYGAQSFSNERFESPHYFEIATENERTTILNNGLPFHRKTGPRMIDSILVVAGETRRKFSFRIAVDASYPMQAAVDALSPPVVIATTGGPPRAGNTGWLFHLNASNVQVTRLIEMLPDPSLMEEHPAETNGFGPPSSSGFALRVMETEGRYRSAILRCYKTPSRARQRDANGLTIAELRVIDDGVYIELSGYEIADIELRFDD